MRAPRCRYSGTKLYDKLLAEGMDPYKVDSVTGKIGVEKLKEFDATLEEVVFVPIKAMVGG